jgi:hypothetical protein
LSLSHADVWAASCGRELDLVAASAGSGGWKCSCISRNRESFQPPEIYTDVYLHYNMTFYTRHLKMPLKVFRMSSKTFLGIFKNAGYKLDSKGLLRHFLKRLSISIYKGIF